MRETGSTVLLRAVFAGCWMGLLAFTSAQDASAPADEAAPIRILLATGGASIDADNQQAILTSGISERVAVPVEWTVKTVSAAFYNDPSWAKGYDVVLHNEHFADRISTAAVDRILAPHQAGLPAVLIHATMLSYPTSDDRWFQFTGVVARSHGPDDPYTVKNLAPEHPAMKGFGPVWPTPQGRLVFAEEVAPAVTRLAEAFSPKRAAEQPVVWTHLYGEKQARVFGTTIGRDNETMLDPIYLDLVTRGLLWSIDRSDAFVSLEEADPSSAGEGEMHLTAFPKNILTGKPATASSTGTVPLHSPDQANDGRHDTRWSAHGNGRGEWWQVDLEEPTDLESIALHWEHNAPYQYRIDVSKDGDSFKTIVDDTYNTAPNQIATHAVSAPGTRQLRITFISGCGEVASLREVAAFAKSDAIAGLENLTTTRSRAFSPTREPALTRDPTTGLSVSPDWQPVHFADLKDVSALRATLEGPVFVAIDTASGGDRIIRVTDGVSTRFTEQVSGASGASGLEWDGEWLYVMEENGLTAHRDLDADGVADESRNVLFDFPGSGVTLGIDGWLYCTIGGSGTGRTIAKDGSAIQLHSGGVVRVRPDGSDLHVYAHGSGDIRSLSISPTLDIIGRSAANDASGWTSRVLSLTGLGHSGYPNRFRNFPGEITPPLAEFPHGEDLGAIWTESGPLIAESTTGRLQQFAEGVQTTWLKAPSLRAISSDGRGTLYLATDEALFQVTGNDRIPAPPTSDLEKSMPEILLSPNAALRLLASRAWLRSGGGEITGLTAIVQNAEVPADIRTAALFTLAQSGAASTLPTLAQLAADANPTIRAMAIRAMGDLPAAENHAVFHSITTEADPRVLKELLLAIVRTESRDSDLAKSVLTLAALNDSAPVRRRAIDALVELRASKTCLEMMKDPSGYKIWPTACDVLGQLHDMTVVYGLIDRVKTTSSSIIRSNALEALARLYLREGGWNATREPTLQMIQGPYLHGTKWEGSQHIRWELEKGLKDRRVSDSFLLGEMAKNGVPVPSFTKLLDATAIDPELEKATIELLLGNDQSIDDASPFLTFIATNDNRPVELRLRAATALARSEDDQAIREALSVVCDPATAEATPLVREALRKAFVENPTHASRYEWFLEKAHSDNAACGELGWAILLRSLQGTTLESTARQEIERALANAPNHPARLQRVLTAIREVRYLPGEDLVKNSLEHSDQAVRLEAAKTAVALDIKT